MLLQAGVQEPALAVHTAAASDVTAVPSAGDTVVSPADSVTVNSVEEQLAAFLSSGPSSNVQALHPGVQGSSSVRVDRLEHQHAAIVTVSAAVRLNPCTGAESGACVPVLDQHPSLDMAVTFASSVAMQTAGAYCKCAHHPLLLATWCERACRTDCAML